jgi:hypothetical protein
MNSENCLSQGAAYRTYSQSGGKRKTPRSILIGFRSLSHSGKIKKNAKSQSERIYRATNLIMGLETKLGCVQEGRRHAEKRKRGFTKYIFQ